MKKVLLLFFYSFLSYAQVGIGTTSPNAQLDVTSTNEGVLIPRVALIASNSVVPLTAPTVSELVYNTATAGIIPNDVSPGYYYWSGSSWISLKSSAKIENFVSSTPIEPNVIIWGAPSALTNVGTNNTAQVFDNTTITRTINVTGVAGSIANVTCTVVLNHTWGDDIDMYLQSPSGQIIELITDNGGSAATNFNVTFSDAGVQNITSWGGGNIMGAYKPEGTLTVSGLTPTITTMAGFNGFSPNGIWTLHLRDDASADNFSFTSFSLSVATAQNAPYRLVGEQSISYNNLFKYSVDANYSANVADNAGAVIALTRSTTSAGATGTTVSSLPGTILNYSADSPNSGSGNIWLNCMVNYMENIPLVNGTYYYQLWVKANVDTPVNNNEIFNFRSFRF